MFEKIFFHSRYGISDRAAAALANGLLTDFGLISDHDKAEVIDAKKVQREKRRICGQTLEQRDGDIEALTCIGLDSKKDTHVPIIETRTSDEDGTTLAFKTTGSIHNLTFTIESGKIVNYLLLKICYYKWFITIFKSMK
jgi:hypothetical protein